MLLNNVGSFFSTDIVERFQNNWPLAETLPYHFWYMPPYDDPSVGYNDQPFYVAPEGAAAESK